MDFAAARQHMVESQVHPNDVTDLGILTAMETTPRETFLPAELREMAYIERELEFAPGRRLLTARDFAKLVSAAAPKKTDLVLNAVCGTGYSTAILAQLADMVVSLENDETLSAKAEENLAALGHSNTAVINGDPANGAANQGPFDLIFLGGGVETVPQTLLSQLKDGGRLATIMIADGVARGVTYKRSGEAFARADHFDATTQTVLPGFAKAKAFVF